MSEIRHPKKYKCQLSFTNEPKGKPDSDWVDGGEHLEAECEGLHLAMCFLEDDDYTMSFYREGDPEEIRVRLDMLVQALSKEPSLISTIAGIR